MRSGLLLLLLVFGVAANRAVHELLVPMHSITPLMCEPIFNDATGATATWFRNGEEIAKVTGRSNHILDGRPLDLKEQVPEVGFLIIPKIDLFDEGDYHCKRDDDGDRGDTSRIRIAYLKPFKRNQPVLIYPPIPQRGDTVILSCPQTKGWPEPNSEPVDYAGGRLDVVKNGSLVIRRYGSRYAGVFECTLSNFADRVTASIHLKGPGAMPLQNTVFHNVSPSTPGCAFWAKNSLLWFLIGCLTTSVIVLVYLLAGMFCYKYTQRRNNFSPLQSFLRADPALAPGFRKVVVPVPDFIRRQNEGVPAAV